jgi:hypothetical protein
MVTIVSLLSEEDDVCTLMSAQVVNQGENLLLPQGVL